MTAAVPVEDNIRLLIAEGLRIDAVFILRNPNSNFGAVNIPYTIEIFDVQQQLIGTRDGKTFLSPRENRPIIQNAIDVKGRIPASADVVLGEITWAENPVGVSSDPRLVVVEKELVRDNSGPEFAEARGVIRNDSPFEYFQVFVNVLLYSQSQDLVAVRITELRNIAPAASREFRVAWRIPIDEAFTVDVHAFTNLFAEGNFVKQYNIVPFTHRRGVPR